MANELIITAGEKLVQYRQVDEVVQVVPGGLAGEGGVRVTTATLKQYCSSSSFVARHLTPKDTVCVTGVTGPFPDAGGTYLVVSTDSCTVDTGADSTPEPENMRLPTIWRCAHRGQFRMSRSWTGPILGSGAMSVPGGGPEVERRATKRRV
jgi:hypothetical protein